MHIAQLSLAAAVRKRWADDTEFGQAIVRFAVSVPVVAYFFYGVEAGWISDSSRISWVIAWAVFFACTAIAILWDICRRPGVYRWRRVIAALADFAANGIVLGVGEEATLPVFGALLWITVGYGIRYGGRYLLLSTIMAQITIAIVIAVSPYWQSHPFQSAAFVITLIIGPGYAFALIARLQSAHRGAEDANRRKSEFLAQVSHDLRQPIHAISLLTTRLSDTELTDSQMQLLARIDQSIHGAIQQLQTFLNVTTIEAGLLQPRLTSVDLGKLIAEQAAQYMTLAQASGNAVHAANSSLVVHTDSIFVTTIIQNLLSNAIKHAPGCDVLIGCRRTGGSFAICVYDRGPGVAGHELPNLTKRYFRASDARLDGTQGLGLGLSIVKQLAESLGLEVSIKSQSGKGTAVWVSGLSAAQPGDLVRNFDEPEPVNQLVNLRVAVIEDDPAVLEATCALIERWGCAVTGFLYPPADLPNCDVVVSDYQFCRGQTLGDFPVLLNLGIPVIVVSGHSPDEVAAQIGGKCMAMLEKPVRAAALRSTLLAARLATGSTQTLLPGGSQLR